MKSCLITISVLFLAVLIGCDNAQSPSGPEIPDCLIEPVWGLWTPVRDQYDSATILKYYPDFDFSEDLYGMADTFGIGEKFFTGYGSGAAIEYVEDTMFMLGTTNPYTGERVKTPYVFEVRGDTLDFSRSSANLVNPRTGMFHLYTRVDWSKIPYPRNLNMQGKLDVPECYWDQYK